MGSQAGVGHDDKEEGRLPWTGQSRPLVASGPMYQILEFGPRCTRALADGSPRQGGGAVSVQVVQQVPCEGMPPARGLHLAPDHYG